MSAQSKILSVSSMSGAAGSSDIEGKAARVAASEWSGREASDKDGKTERSNGAFGESDIEGKAARVAASERGSERVSNGREHMSQWGNERVSNPWFNYKRNTTCGDTVG